MWWLQETETRVFSPTSVMVGENQWEPANSHVPTKKRRLEWLGTSPLILQRSEIKATYIYYRQNMEIYTRNLQIVLNIFGELNLVYWSIK